MEAARDASIEDLEQLAALALLAAAERGDERGGPEWEARSDPAMLTADGLAAVLHDPAALLVAGTIDDALVGLARAHVETLREGGRVAIVDELFVLPEARGVGVGEALLERMIAWAAECGCADIEAVALPGNRDAKNLFERAGLVARAIVVQRRLQP